GDGFAQNQAGIAFFASQKKGSGAPNDAKSRECRTRYRAQPRSLDGTARLSALHYGLMGVASQPGPGQRFLELPDANGRSALPLRRQCSEHLTVRTRAGRA